MFYFQIEGTGFEDRSDVQTYMEAGTVQEVTEHKVFKSHHHHHQEQRSSRTMRQRRELVSSQTQSSVKMTSSDDVVSEAKQQADHDQSNDPKTSTLSSHHHSLSSSHLTSSSSSSFEHPPAPKRPHVVSVSEITLLEESGGNRHDRSSVSYARHPDPTSRHRLQHTVSLTLSCMSIALMHVAWTHRYYSAN